MIFQNKSEEKKEHRLKTHFVAQGAFYPQLRMEQFNQGPVLRGS